MGLLSYHQPQSSLQVGLVSKLDCLSSYAACYNKPFWLLFCWLGATTWICHCQKSFSFTSGSSFSMRASPTLIRNLQRIATAVFWKNAHDSLILVPWWRLYLQCSLRWKWLCGLKFQKVSICLFEFLLQH